MDRNNDEVLLDIIRRQAASSPSRIQPMGQLSNPDNKIRSKKLTEEEREKKARIEEIKFNKCYGIENDLF